MIFSENRYPLFGIMLLNVERHRQAERNFVGRPEAHSELPAGHPDHVAAAAYVAGAGREQEHELVRHDARRLELEPRSLLRYVRQQTGADRRSVAKIDMRPIFEVLAPLLAFFSCHFVPPRAVPTT